MEHTEIATLAGVSLDDLEILVSGFSTANVARRLGVTMGDINDFIKGSASNAMAQRLGFTAISAGDDLRRRPDLKELLASSLVC
jgi:plasmid maintenance system antidote protein VapI